MEKDEFIETGMIVSRPIFERQRPNEKLHRNCIIIVSYAGDNYIQILKSKGYMLDSDIYVTLELAEEILWERICYNFDEN